MALYLLPIPIMKKITLIIVTLFIFSSCIKEEQKQNTDSQIIELLNQNKSDEALQQINEALKTNNSDELLYLKASALSMSAGVDIYALFPLLKVKIFDVAIAQWSENREFQKKAESQKLDIGINSDDIKKEKDDDKSKAYVPLNLENIKYFYSPSTRYSFIDNDFCEIGISASVTKDIYGENSVYITYRSESEDSCNNIEKNSYNLLSESDELSPEIDEKIKSALSDAHHKKWLTRRGEANKKNGYIKALGTFWTLIDMVPMVSKIPKVGIDGFKKLEEAQAILSKIRESRSQKDDELGQKTRKQLMMISALKIVAHIQNSFDLSLVKSPIDLLCKSNDKAAEELLASEKDAIYLLNSVEDPEIINKNKGLFDELKGKYQDILENESQNPELKDARVQKLADDLLRQKKLNCE